MLDNSTNKPKVSDGFYIPKDPKYDDCYVAFRSREINQTNKSDFDIIAFGKEFKKVSIEAKKHSSEPFIVWCPPSNGTEVYIQR